MAFRGFRKVKPSEITAHMNLESDVEWFSFNEYYSFRKIVSEIHVICESMHKYNKI